MNGLPDPPDRIRNELESPRPVKSFGGRHQTHVARADKIGQRHAMVLVFPGDANDKTEIRTNQPVPGPLISLPDPVRECNLCLAIKRLRRSDIPEMRSRDSLSCINIPATCPTSIKIMCVAHVTSPDVHSARLPKRPAQAHLPQQKAIHFLGRTGLEKSCSKVFMEKPHK